MANRKKPKTELGQPARLDERDLVSRILETLSGSAESGVPESLPLENLAFDKGAALLFRHGKEGCISSLGVVLIPDENKEKHNPLPEQQALMTAFDLRTFKGNKKAREEAQAKFIATLSAPGPRA